jgi:tRNA-dihydrouridine synthase B
MGAALAVSEMMTSNPALWHREKSVRRADHRGEGQPIAVQIAGADPRQMAEAARVNVDQGAQIIDINMGCPAKKVCNVAAGSALLRDEALVGRILDAVVRAVNVPVTLKTRTGWCRDSKNALSIGRLAQESGIAALALHGRTRQDLYRGEAEYDTIRAVKQSLTIPVIANGDIDTPQKARQVLDYTGADAVMIGRAAQGRPWIFREMLYFLEHGVPLPPPRVSEASQILLEHLDDLYGFYGEYTGCRVARKHIAWTTRGLHGAEGFRSAMLQIETTDDQRALVAAYFSGLAAESDRLMVVEAGASAHPLA